MVSYGWAATTRPGLRLHGILCCNVEKACREYASQCVCMRYPNCLKPSAQQQRHFGQSCDTTKYDRAAHEYNHDEACRCNSAFCSKGHGCTLPSTTPQTCHKRQCPYDAMLLIQIKNLAASMYNSFWQLKSTSFAYRKPVSCMPPRLIFSTLRTVAMTREAANVGVPASQHPCSSSMYSCMPGRLCAGDLL